MSPITHLLAGWLVAEIPRGLSRRERACITVAGVAPDLDGLGAVAEFLTRGSPDQLLWFSRFHHQLHALWFALAVAGAAALLAGKRRWVTGGMALAAFHLHLLGDLLGGRGPDGYQWPLPYLAPWPGGPELAWGGQWALASWPNLAITAAALLATLALARRRGYSLLGLVAPRGDALLVKALRERFPLRGERA